jgi:predicted DNA-binding WGR domain protein
MTNATADPAAPSVLLEKIDHARSMARFYAISVEPTLFAETALVRRWGRIGTAGRQMIELHASPVIAQIEQRRWITRKLRRGYIARD